MLVKKGTFFLLVFAAGLFTCPISNAQVNIITTFAGDSVSGYCCDDSVANHAELISPSGVAVDRHGNVFIADQNNNRVRKVNAEGIITTLAGNGSFGYTGDSSVATSATLSAPTGVAVDKYGNVYIADEFNEVIRKINTTGIITTIAGSGALGYGGDSGVATAAKLWHPADVCVDDIGNVYIADQDNNRIRKVDTFGIITTIAGNGTPGYNGDNIVADSAELNFPQGIAVDKYGNVYVADFYNSRIRKIDTAGIITTVAGNGAGGYSGDDSLATSASLFDASAVAVDDTGNIYISDYYNSRIRKVNIAGIITTLTGSDTSGFRGDNGPAIDAEINYPEGVAVDTMGNVYIADYNNSRVRKIMKDTATTLTTVINKVTLSSVEVFPNPSAGILNIIISGSQKEYMAEVYDVIGQKVYCSTFNSLYTSIDLTSMAVGIYTLYLRSGGYVAIKKLAIRH